MTAMPTHGRSPASRSPSTCSTPAGCEEGDPPGPAHRRRRARASGWRATACAGRFTRRRRHPGAHPDRPRRARRARRRPRRPAPPPPASTPCWTTAASGPPSPPKAPASEAEFADPAWGPGLDRRPRLPRSAAHRARPDPRPAPTRRASCTSSTPRGTAPAAGARWRSAATARRPRATTPARTRR